MRRELDGAVLQIDQEPAIDNDLSGKTQRMRRVARAVMSLTSLAPGVQADPLQPAPWVAATDRSRATV